MAPAPENATLQRGRFRLHRSTCAILVVAAAVLVLIIVPGEKVQTALQLAHSNSGFFFAEPSTYRFEHGWPLVYLRRQVESFESFNGVPWLQSVGWSTEGSEASSGFFWERKMSGWMPWMLFSDILAAALVLALLAAFLERRLRRRALWQFSLCELMCLMLATSAALGWWMISSRSSAAELKFMEHAYFDSPQVEYRGPLWLSRAVGAARLPFHHLTQIQFHYNGSLPIGEYVDHFPFLEQLNIYVPVTDDDLGRIGRHQRLRFLYIDPNAARRTGSGIPGDPRNSETYQAETPQVTDAGVAQLQAMRSLRSLGIVSSQISDVGLAHLQGLRSLEQLSIISPLITDSGVAHLKNLTNLSTLTLGECPGITSVSLSHLERMERMEELALGGTSIENDGLAAIGRMRKLRKLSLQAAPISGDGLRHLAPLKELVGLCLDRTNVIESDLKELGSLQSLRYLTYGGRLLEYAELQQRVFGGGAPNSPQAGQQP